MPYNSTIQPKLKICKRCEDPCYLFSHGMCKNCWQLTDIEKWNMGNNKLISLRQSDNSPAKPFKIKKNNYIAPLSKTRAEALKKYRRLRDKYFQENPVCEFDGCNSKNITLHHKRGRIGAFLTDKRFFCSLCPKHHQWVNEHPDEAKKLNLVDSRLAIF